MQLKTLDLYEYFGYSKPAYSTGILHCYIQKTDVVVDGDRRPAVLILPGGGYGHVSERESEPVALRMLAAGFQAFVLHYSVAPAVFPVALREAAMAMAFIRKNALDLGVDPGKVAAMGFSAGGHLCGLLSTLYDSREVADLGAPAQLRPDALGLCYPVAVSWGHTHEGSFRNLCGEDVQLRQRLSLDRLVREDMPPVFLWHTRDDGSVPCRNSLELARALEERGVLFSLHIYRSGPHGLSTADSQAYPAGQVPACSWDVPGWMEALQQFWKEIGLKREDRHE